MLRIIASIVAVFFAVGCSQFIESDSEFECIGEPCDAPGALRCTGTLERQICAAAADACVVWQDTSACDTGQQCISAGDCAQDECTLGAIRCVSSSEVSVCTLASNGLAVWGAPSMCDGDAICTETSGCELPTCEEVGQMACVDDVQFASCEDQGSGLRWSDTVPCPEGQRCVLGVCGEDACATSGETRCVSGSETLYQLCGVDSTGFKVWSTSLTCPSGTTCYLGGCGQHECGPSGLRACDDNGAVLECQVNDTGFLLWNGVGLCPEGEECRGAGMCGSDTCVQGSTRCANGAVESCVLGESGFLDWSVASVCGDDGICIAGECIAHECDVVGQSSCHENNTVRVCGESKSGVRILLEPTPCPLPGDVCKGDGVCGQDECIEAGAKQCAADAGVMECALNEDGFTYWLPVVACPPGDTCLNGQCGQDECVLGEASCIDAATIQVCVAGDLGFAVWNQYPCNENEMVCLDGGVCAFPGAFDLWDEAVTGSAALATLSDGTFMAAWTAPVFSSFQVKLRRYSQNGVPLEDPINIIPPVLANLPFPVLKEVQLDADTVAPVLAWFNADASAVRARWIGDLGEESGPVMNLPTTAVPSIPQLTLHDAPSGPRLLYVAAVPENHTVESLPLDGGSSSEPTVLGESGGEVLGIDCADGHSVCVFAGSASGVQLVGSAGIMNVAASPASSPAVAVSGDGSVLVAWVADEDGIADNGSEVLRIQRFGADFTAIDVPAALISTDHLKSPRLVATDAGYFLVFEQGVAAAASIRGQFLDTSGTPYGIPAALGDVTAGPQVAPRLEALADGRLLVVWRDGFGLGARIKGRFIDIW